MFQPKNNLFSLTLQTGMCNKDSQDCTTDFYSITDWLRFAETYGSHLVQHLLKQVLTEQSAQASVKAVSQDLQGASLTQHRSTAPTFQFVPIAPGPGTDDR